LLLLRRDVRRRAHGEPGLGHARVPGADRDAEVDEPDVPVSIEKQVRRLDVTVDEPASVHVVDRQGGLAQPAERGLPRGRRRHYALGEALVQELHREVGASVPLAGVVDRDDEAAAPGRGRCGGLAAEPDARGVVPARGLAQDLERDGTLEQPVVHLVDA
jgi:hypothetical protein